MKALEVSQNGRCVFTAGIGRLLGVVWSVLELERGVPDYFLQAWDCSADHAECIAWPVPLVRLGDQIGIKIIEIDQPPAAPFRWRSGDRGAVPPAGARWTHLRKKWQDAVARSPDHRATDPGDERPMMTGFALSHNGQYELTAATPGDDAYLYWVVEIHGGLLNHIMRGVSTPGPARASAGRRAGSGLVMRSGPGSSRRRWSLRISAPPCDRPGRTDSSPDPARDQP